MGLPTGPHGVKEIVKTRCVNAWGDFSSLKSARNSQGYESFETVAILDGNVLVRQVPTKATTFEEYTTIFNRFVTHALDAADVVVVVFDEPAGMTRAKAEEQARRDLQSKKSAPVMSADLVESFAPVTDEYDYDVVLNANPHDVMRSRKARQRMFDCICKNTMNVVMSTKEYKAKILVFDGIDPRGASRAYGDPREPCMYSNDERAETFLARKADGPVVAEGDLKLTDVESEIQYLRDTQTYFVSIKLVLICTIDTDSLAIELMHQSAKNEQRAARPDLPAPMKTVLCLREAAKKRKENDSNEYGQSASFACFDMDAVHSTITGLLAVPDGYHRHATALLASAWCLCGCDFVHLKGMRSDVVFEAVSDLCRSDDGVRLLQCMEGAWQIRLDTTPEMVQRIRSSMTMPLLQIVTATASRLATMPRMGRSAKAIKDVLGCELTIKMLLLKGAWCAVYWSGLQCSNSELADWGFVSRVG